MLVVIECRVRITHVADVGAALYVCSQLDGHEDRFHGNKVVLTGNKVGGFKCDGAGKTVVHDNAYYTATGNVTECKLDFHAWQAKGEDKGSSVSTYPADDVIIGWAKAKLGF